MDAVGNSLEGVVEALASAPLQPSLWPEVLNGLSRAGGGWGTHLFGVSAASAPDFSFSDAIPDESMTEWLALGGMNPVLNPRARLATLRPAFRVVGDHDLGTLDERRANVFYNEFYPRYDAPHMVASSFSCGSDLRIVLAVFRSRGQGAFEPGQAAELTALLPHVNAALRMQRAIEHRGAEIAAGAFEALGGAIILVGADGRILEVSAAGLEALRLARFVQSLGGRLGGVTRASDADLAQALSRATGARGFEHRSSTVVLRDCDGRIQVADVTAMPTSAYGLRLGARAIVTLAPRRRPQAKLLLRRTFGLSDAEATVALALTSQDRLGAIAEERSVSLATVRNQLRAIFAKVGVNSQTALVRVLCSVVGGGAD